MTDIKYWPKHVALIPDGNRTWAKEKGLHKFIWHLNGFNRIVELATYIFTKTPIQVFTAWGLSTENLKNRSKDELEYLFELYKKIPTDLFNMMKENKVNFKLAWDILALPKHLQDFLYKKVNELVFPNSSKYFVLALNYGWQDEILRWMQKLVENKEEVNKNNLEKYLDFWWLPPVELVIRTKQKLAKRLSGFMLWWIGYAQLYFTDIYCPDFDVNELKKALAWYNETATTQNFGK